MTETKLLPVALASAIAALALQTSAKAQTITEKYTVERTITLPQTQQPPAPTQPPIPAFDLTCPRGDDTVHIELAFAGGTTDAGPSHFSVGHELPNGDLYDRSRQYHDTRSWSTPGKWEYFWSGYANNLRGQVMIGKLVRHDDGRWFYGELTSVNGRINMGAIFSCY